MESTYYLIFNIRKWAALCLLTGFLLSFAACIARASTRYVSPNGSNSSPGTQPSPFETIQYAISNSISGDTIVLEDGVYEGVGNVDLNTNGRTITFTSVDGPSETTINCQGTSDAFTMENGEGTSGSPAVIENLTIEDGDGETVDAGHALAVVNLTSVNVNISNCVISGDTGANNYGYASLAIAASGGGTTISNCSFSDDLGNCVVSVDGGTCTIANSSFENNVNSYASIINYDGTLTVMGSSFDNDSPSAIYEQGAGSTSYNISTITSCTFTKCPDSAIDASNNQFTLSRCTFTNNGSFDGAAVYLDATGPYAQYNMSNCTFDNNSVAGYGGAVFIIDDSYTSEPDTISCCMFANNSAVYDSGALCINKTHTAAPPSVVNCAFIGNSATNGPGGAVADGVGCAFDFCSFSGNSASTDGGAIEAVAGTTVEDSILYGDTAATDSEINNLAALTYSDVQQGYAGTGNIEANPLYDSLSTGNLEIPGSSPCSAAGIAINGVTTDINGAVRQNPPSMGAYQAPPPPPTITGFTPSFGPAGAAVTITGTNFKGLGENVSSVAFNGAAATTVSVTSATLLTAVVPAAASTGNITVTTNGGTATSTGSFSFVPAPIVTSITPNCGPAATRVTITGTGFSGAGWAATGVKFNGLSVTAFAVASPTTLTAYAPTGVTTGPVTVVTPGGSATSLSSFTVLSIAGLKLSAATVSGGTTVTGTVTLSSAAPVGGTVVTLTSSSTAATVPTSVIVLAGSTTATFVIATPGAGTVAISASIGASKTSATLIVSAGIENFHLSSATVVVGAALSGRVTLYGNAAGSGDVVSLSSSSPDVKVPATVTVPAGSDTVIFSLTAATTGSATVTATIGTSSQTVTVAVTNTISNFHLSSASVVVGAALSGRVTLAGNATGSGTIVSLSSGSSSVKVPTTVTVPAGTDTVAFSLTAAATGSATITATLGTSTQTAAVTVTNVIENFHLSSSAVAVDGSLSGRVTLAGNATGSGTIVSLSSNSSAVQVPATVTIPAGADTLKFSLKAASSGAATITATLGTSSATAEVTVEN